MSSNEEDESSSGTSSGGSISLSNINDSEEEHEPTTTTGAMSLKHIVIGVADDGSSIESKSHGECRAAESKEIT
eukprot:14083672-Ditylum_brightwellii.AAC.1